MRTIAFCALVALAGCSSAVMLTSDPRRAVVLAPYSKTIGPFGVLTIREGEVFYPSTVDGAAAWCSAGPTYFAPGEGRPTCLFDPVGARAEGWFATAYVVGTAGSFRYPVDVPYRVAETTRLPPR